MAFADDWQPHHQQLIAEAEALEATISELTVRIDQDSASNPDADQDPRDHLAWLQRQHAAVLVLLHEAERTLLASDTLDEDES